VATTSFKFPVSSFTPRRAIIHINVADFAAAVEAAIDPRLRDRPLVIAARGSGRTTVFDMNEHAFAAGVRKGMALALALRRCAGAQVVAPHPERYEKAMADLLGQVLPFSPLVEAGPDDGHLFIDATGSGRLFGPPADVARRIQSRIKDRLGVTPAWSVAPNKLTAKAATRLVKPAGEALVAPGQETALMAPLPLALVPGISARETACLRQFNLTSAGQVAAMQLEQLQAVFGLRAQALFDAVRGIDHSAVVPAGQRPPRVSADHLFGEDTNDTAMLEAALYQLVERIGLPLREKGRVAGTIAVTIDHCDGMRCQRPATLKPASADDPVLFAAARRALALALTRRVRVRRIALACVSLVPAPARLDLFGPRPAGRGGSLTEAIDRIRKRFGPEAIRIGKTLTAFDVVYGSAATRNREP